MCCEVYNISGRKRYVNLAQIWEGINGIVLLQEYSVVFIYFWLKITYMYYLTVLGVRCLKSASIGKNQGDFGPALHLEALGDNLFPCLFQLLEAAGVRSFFPSLQIQSQLCKILNLSLTPSSASRSIPLLMKYDSIILGQIVIS